MVRSGPSGKARRAVLRTIVGQDTDARRVALMQELVSMSDEDRERLLDDFWNEVTDGLTVHPAFIEHLHGMRPVLPDEPDSEQLQAWIELAELVQDEDFRRRIRQMGEHHSAARDTGEAMAAPSNDENQQWWAWSEAAGEAMAAGHAPDSAPGRQLAAEVSAAMGVPAAEAADRIAVGTDARAERYWQLMATINGCEPQPAQVPRAEWIIAALRATG